MDNQHKKLEALADAYIARTDKSSLRLYKRAQEQLLPLYTALFAHLEPQKRLSMSDLYRDVEFFSLLTTIQRVARELGTAEEALLTKQLELVYDDSYAIALPNIARADSQYVKQIVGAVWCADGKRFSDRIWLHKDALVNLLNEQLIDAVAKGETDFSARLRERFAVSYHQAQTLARTEIAHIQTQAALDRYSDSGISQVEFFAAPGERMCDECGQLHGKTFPLAQAQHLVPRHPNCRCALLPYIAN